jgi:SAM-dependent methyltransferase
LWRRARRNMSTVGKYNQERRDKWIRDRIAELPRGGSLLDVGAGMRLYEADVVRAGLNYRAHDFPQYATFFPKAKRPDVICDVCELAEYTDMYDAVLCSEVLEHVPDPAQALAAIVSVLRPGGVLILTAPFNSATHFAPHHYCTGFSRYWYEYHLPRLGCDVVRMDHHGSFFDYLMQEVNRQPEIAAKHCKVGYYRADPDEVERLGHPADTDSGSWEFLCWGWHVVAVKR